MSGPALYRLDIDTRELKQVTPFDANSYSFLWKVLGISSDGSTAYFMSWNVYDEGATPFESNLYMAKGGVVRHIATLGSRETGGGASYALSPDGKTLAFSSVASPTGYDNRSPACSADPSLFALDGECSEVYVYDAATDQLTCPTCLEGVRKAHSSLAPQNATISEYLGGDHDLHAQQPGRVAADLLALAARLDLLAPTTRLDLLAPTTRSSEVSAREESIR